MNKRNPQRLPRHAPGYEKRPDHTKGRYSFQRWLEQIGLYHGCDVYRIYKGNTLLYVGMTGELISRLRQHWQEKPWMWSATHVKVQTYATREEATQQETLAIQTEEPLHNIQRRPRQDA